ncbi:hypothetical protein [Staphylococcus warneri]|nr:hypothetical protein [Staphylococcus warneri]PNN19267.1 hypothetical protein AL513_012725 [Staphylococcus warneri]
MTPEQYKEITGDEYELQAK